MRSAFLLAAIITASIALAAQATSPQPDQSQQSLCTVAGRVVTAAEGTPLKSVHVMLAAESPARGEPRTYGVTSDSSGAFVLKNVAPGRYRLIAERTGYVSQQYHSSDTQGGALLGLQSRQQVNDILFRLVLAAVVTGRVTDEDEEPMAGIRIMALRHPTEEEQEEEESFGSHQQDQLMPAGSARTDDRGQYRIFGLKPGEYYLQATESLQPPEDVPAAQDYFVREALGAEYAPVYYPGVLQRGQAETVLLRPGDEAQVDFSLHHIRTVEISGRVLAPDGKPVNAIIALQDAGVENYFEGQNTNTDAEGKFELKGVPPGNYILMAYQQASDEVYYPSARQELTVGNDNIESLTVALSRGADFTGRIVTEGVTRPNYLQVSLHAIGGKDSGYHGGRVKPDGSFELKNVPEGNYAIQVYGEDESRWYVKSARLGSDDVLEHGLEVEKGTGGRLEIVISAARTQVDGSVTQDEKPAVGARVRIVADPETPYNRMRRRDTTTDQNGQFVLPGVAPGKYRVTARSPADYAGEDAKADPQSVTVSEGGHKNIQLKLVPVQSQ
ncbi:MAG TPA: carboxypeptidase-like regulatory domain-containing protein [Terriglobales bacterium]|nr:carboxypeptidase-like regulatory domain-containing protein [Terriglobales bacterium]